MTEAAKGAGEVAQNIFGVAHSAQDTAQGATHSQKAAHELALMSAQLRQVVQHFKLQESEKQTDHPTVSTRTATGAPRHQPERELVVAD